MSNIFRITPSLHAPVAATVDSAGSSGGPWDTTISLAILAWYDKQETDGDMAGFVAPQAGITGFTPGSDDRLQLEWRNLSKVAYDHISAYVTQDDGFTVKLQPISTTPLLNGNIPPYAQSAFFDVALDGTTHKRQVPVVSTTGRVSQSILTVTSATRHIVLAGDYTDHIEVGDVIWITGSAKDNGFYSVQTVSFGAGATTITTVGAIPSDAALANNKTASIISTTSGTKTIVIAGDQTAFIAAADKIYITDAPTINGTYTVVSRSFGGGNTSIVVTEAIVTTAGQGTLSFNDAGDLEFGHPIFRIAGNRQINFPDGISFAIVNSADNDAAGLLVEDASSNIDVDGEFTDIQIVPLSTSLNFQNGTSAQGQLIFSTNYIDVLRSGNNNDALDISLIMSCDLTKREQKEATFDGRYAPKAWARNTTLTRIDFEFEYGGMTAADLFKLIKYARLGVRCQIQDISDSDVIQFPSSYAGYLEIPNDLLSREKYGQQLIRIGFKIEAEQDNLVDMPAGGTGAFFQQITDANDTDDTITVDGDWTWLIFKGRHIEIAESTHLGNAFYYVESSEYDSSNDETTISLFPPLAADTAPDGYVKVLGYE